MRKIWKSLYRLSRRLTAMSRWPHPGGIDVPLYVRAELQEALLQFPQRIQLAALEAASWPWQYRKGRLTEMVKWDYSSEYGKARG